VPPKTKESIMAQAKKAAEISGDAGGKGKTIPEGRPFPKGKSGNPGGLPAWVREVRELAGKHSKEAIERLVTLMRQKKQLKVAHAAACAILDRAGAKPIQPIAVTDGDGRPAKALDLAKLSDQQLVELEALLTAARTEDEAEEADEGDGE
jgi:hypothetical protein